MKIGLLIIASEVLDGKIADLNTKYLAEFLRGENLELWTSKTVRDSEDEIIRGLDSLYEVCDLIITSGGLGPTKDDLTKNVIGKYFKRQMNFSPMAHTVAEENYIRMNRVYPGKEHGYSFLPDGFTALSNSSGFAPGLYVEDPKHFLFAAPGVPREFRSIIADHITPWIKKHIRENGLIENVIIRTRRIPEEKIFGEVDPTLWQKLENYGEVSSLPILLGVDIGVKIKAQTPSELMNKKEAVLKIIEASPVRPSVWHFGPEKLEEVIIMRATAQKLSFGFAESCTGGLCSHRITNVSGSSRSFKGSIICYDTEVKKNLLHVPAETIEEFGVVSIETAQAMAEGLANVLGLDFAISTTGIAGPTGGSDENPVGTVCLGLYARGKVSSYKVRLFGDREQLKERFAQAALMGLLEEMEKFA